MAVGRSPVSSSGGVVRLKATADQVWAFDADYLYRRLDVLKPLGRHYVRRIHLLELGSDILLVAGVISAFLVAWWTVIPLVGLSCLQRHANRRMVGEVAARAAEESTDVFLYLYNSGVLSVERPRAERRRSDRPLSEWSHPTRSARLGGARFPGEPPA